jgi:transposase-like protein
VVRIAGERMYLWRAVDHESEVLDMQVQPPTRHPGSAAADAQAAEKAQ